MRFLSSIKEDAARLINTPCGQRFVGHYDSNNHHRSHPLRRAMALGLAGLLFVIGFILLFIPGPGTPFIILAMAVLASQNRAFAAWLDRLDLYLTGLWHKHHLTQRLKRLLRRH